MTRRLTLTVACLLCAWAANGADPKKSDPSQIGNRDVGKGINLYSVEKEIAMGRQLAEEVRRQTKMIDDPLISEYVNRLGQNLARNSDAKVPFTFEVIDDPGVNAFALPGGYVFVNSGLIDLADQENELAAAIAHEIAHVAVRHMTRQATLVNLGKAGAAPLGVLLGGAAGMAVRQAAQTVVPMSFLTFGRQDEAEADYLGVQYLYAAGYDPTGAISIFEKIESMEQRRPGAVSKAFSSHPPGQDRIGKTEREIEQILPSRPDYVITTSAYRDIRQRLIDLQGSRRDPENDRPKLRVAPDSGQVSEQREPIAVPRKGRLN